MEKNWNFCYLSWAPSYLPIFNVVKENIYVAGPTLSTSTSSFEALDPHDPNLSRLATTMFNKTADYLYGELTATQVIVCYSVILFSLLW